MNNSMLRLAPAVFMLLSFAPSEEIVQSPSSWSRASSPPPCPSALLLDGVQRGGAWGVGGANRMDEPRLDLIRSHFGECISRLHGNPVSLALISACERKRKGVLLYGPPTTPTPPPPTR